MIFSILGKSATGKTTVLNELVKRNYGDKIVTTTTRPIRDGEVHGEDYNFTSEHTFDIMNEQGKLISVFEAENGWKYGIDIASVDLSKNQFLVIEPSGYNELLNYVGKNNVYSFLIHSLYSTRMVRLFKRGDKFEEILRRSKSDDIDFDDFENKVHFNIINNFNTEQALDQIIGELQKIGK